LIKEYPCGEWEEGGWEVIDWTVERVPKVELGERGREVVYRVNKIVACGEVGERGWEGIYRLIKMTSTGKVSEGGREVWARYWFIEKVGGGELFKGGREGAGEAGKSKGIIKNLVNGLYYNLFGGGREVGKRGREGIICDKASKRGGKINKREGKALTKN